MTGRMRRELPPPPGGPGRGLGLVAGVVADRLVPDPPDARHPVAWFGRWAGWLERRMWADSRARGAATAFQQGRPVPEGPGWTRGGRAPGNREAQQAPGATPSSAPTKPQTDALF